MENSRLMLKELHNEHLAPRGFPDGDPVRVVDGYAVVGGDGDEIGEPDGGLTMAALVILCACVGFGFAAGWVVGAWMALGMR